MSEVLPEWTTIAAFIIIAACLSIIGVIMTAVQVIIEKLRNKNKRH